MNKVVIYWTSTGNTQIMAETIAQAMDAPLYNVSDFLPLDISNYDYIALGCPACGEEELDDSEFAPFFEEILPLLANKKVMLFGSYGWGEGEWMKAWEQQVLSAEAELFEEGQIVLEIPDNDYLLGLEQFTKRFIS